MGRLVLILLGSLCAASASLVHQLPPLPHAVVEKSFDDALRECAEYFLVSDCELKRYYKEGFPDTKKVKQLIRCALFNLNVYDDETGVVEYRMENFFKPCPKDRNYVKRTRACVKKALAEICPKDVYSRPYATFLCYYQEYGNIAREQQFIANTDLELWQLQRFTASVVNLPYEVIVKYSEGCILKDRYFPQMLYVAAVRGGYFSTDGRDQYERIYTQFGVPQLLSQCTKQCTADVVEKHCLDDYVTIVHQIYIKCVHPYLQVEDLGQATAKKEIACINRLQSQSKSHGSSAYKY